MYSHDSPVHTAQARIRARAPSSVACALAFAFVLVLVLAEEAGASPRFCTYRTYSSLHGTPDTPDKYLHMGLRGNFLKMRHLSTTPRPPHVLPFLHQPHQDLLPCSRVSVAHARCDTARSYNHEYPSVCIRDRVERGKFDMGNQCNLRSKFHWMKRSVWWWVNCL